MGMPVDRKPLKTLAYSDVSSDRIPSQPRHCWGKENPFACSPFIAAFDISEMYSVILKGLYLILAYDIEQDGPSP